MALKCLFQLLLWCRTFLLAWFLADRPSRYSKGGLTVLQGMWVSHCSAEGWRAESTQLLLQGEQELPQTVFPSSGCCC